MIHEYEILHKQAAAPQSVASNASVSCAIIDTKGYNYARFIVDIGATNINIASLYVNESDLSNMGSAAIVSGSNFGGDNNDAGSTSSLPSNGSTNTAVCILINCKARKRYLQMVMSTAVLVNAAVLVSAACDLSRPAETPRSASEAGLATRMVVP